MKQRTDLAAVDLARESLQAVNCASSPIVPATSRIGAKIAARRPLNVIPGLVPGMTEDKRRGHRFDVAILVPEGMNSWHCLCRALANSDPILSVT
jgi:hypothetical protein